MLDPNPVVAGRGVKMLQDAGIEVSIGVMEKECRELNKRFICYHEKHRPYIILKWAQSADGFIDNLRENREQPVAILSSPFTKQLVHKMRAENMAILVGTRTAVLDNPGLRTTRWNGNNPLRVVLDRTGKIPDESKLFDGKAQTLVFTENEKYTQHPNTTICIIDFAANCWQQIMNQLYQMKINSLIVEGGSQVLNDLIALQLWDEIQVETSPVTLNNGVKAPLFHAIMHKEEHYDGHIMRHYRK
jgi:diaminohydroxyphosphoribosylaminopyrimidine deaminase/5-amino-6-(5-phosphoribosylamino)uracil reductase